MINRIAKVVVGLPVPGPFDYWVDETLRAQIAVGKRVCISFGGRKRIGYVVGLAAHSRLPKEKLKSVLAVIDTVPLLTDELLQLTGEVGRYYGCSWGEVIETSLPKALRTATPVDFQTPEDFPKRIVNGGETVLVHNLNAPKTWAYLLDNIRQAISSRQGVMILVPEASGIPAIAEILQQISDRVIVLDRQLKSKQELSHWLRVRSAQAQVVLGTRSVVFAPLDCLGLLIVLQEDHPAYKQEQSPFYHGRDVALMRSQINGSRTILESMTPSTESWWQAAKGKTKFVSFSGDKSAGMQVIDLSDYRSRKRILVSVPLRQAIEKTVGAGGKTMLFLNRKGFTTLTCCPQCQFTLRCPRCETNLVYRYAQKKMVCGHCHHTAALPEVCPQCQSSYLRSSGTGIEKLESEIARLFPQYRLSLYDKDTKSLSGDFDILIATQAVFRVQHRLSLQMVGVVSVDSELNRPDFRSAHKTFSLLVQLRQMAREKFMVQTRLPDNYCFQLAATMDAQQFYREEIKFRRQLKLPPFSHLISIVIRAAREQVAFEQANLLYQRMQETARRGITMTEPQADYVPKLRGKYRFMILVKGKSVKPLLSFIRIALKGIKRKSGALMSVNVDP